MKGIKFVIDDEGKRTAVIIDLEEYGEIWEDIYDSLLIEARRNDPLEDFDDVKERLRKAGKLHDT